MRKSLKRTLPSSIATVLLILAPGASLAQQRLGAPPGKGSFERYCSSCHWYRRKGRWSVSQFAKSKASRSHFARKEEQRQFSGAASCPDYRWARGRCSSRVQRHARVGGNDLAKPEKRRASRHLRPPYASNSNYCFSICRKSSRSKHANDFRGSFSRAFLPSRVRNSYAD